MEPANMESDLYMGGVTLRSLLENRDLFTLPPPAKRTEKDEKEGGDVYSDATAAFLGPNLWDKTLSDFKLEYIDLDDLLGSNVSSEEGQHKRTEGAHSAKAQAAQQLLHLNSSRESQSTHPQGGSACNSTPSPLPQQQQQQQLQQQQLQHHHHHQQPQQHPHNIASPSSPESSCGSQHDPEDGKSSPCFVECKFSPNDLALATVPGQENFDPTLTILHEDDLKPQPMIKKSRKHFVPEDLKDDKYWARRRKNNIAAKRSREARRIKENQIVLRASYLEKENNTLKDDVQRLKAENEMLRNQLKKYEH